MRVLHLGNTNNIGYEIARSLREVGVESTLLVDRSDFITSDPSWESPEPVSQTQSPDWIRYYRNTQRHRLSFGSWNIRFPYFHRLQQSVDLACLAGAYDLLQAYNYDVALCLTQPRKPFIAFCIGGDLNVTALSHTLVGWLMRRAYRRARFVFYSNINMIDAVQRLGLRNAHFMPLPVNTEKYVPSNNSAIREQLGCEFLLFSPTRHAWETKGNNKLLHAFAQLVRESSRKIKLMLCDWGEDLARSHALSRELRIEDNIVWRPLMPKRELIRFYHASDIVLDQFNLGAFGLTTLEAMACGKPVVLNCHEEFVRECYPEMPPVDHAASSEEILAVLRDLLKEPQKREKLGQAARQWILRYHSASVVARRHLEFYRHIVKESS